MQDVLKISILAKADLPCYQQLTVRVLNTNTKCAETQHFRKSCQVLCVILQFSYLHEPNTLADFYFVGTKFGTRIAV